MWLLLVGCAPGTFTEDEALVVLEAVSSVNDDVYALVWSRTRPLPGSEITPGDTADTGPGKGMTWHTAAEGGSFDGTIDGPGSWTGTVSLDGAYDIELATLDEWVYTWGMDAAYADVGYGGLTLDGDARWDIEAEYGGSTFTHTSTLTGDLVAKGSATGAGEIATITRVTLSGGRYVVGVTGTIGGHDVSRQYDASAYGL